MQLLFLKISTDPDERQLVDSQAADPELHCFERLHDRRSHRQSHVLAQRQLRDLPAQPVVGAVAGREPEQAGLNSHARPGHEPGRHDHPRTGPDQVQYASCVLFVVLL